MPCTIAKPCVTVHNIICSEQLYKCTERRLLCRHRADLCPIRMYSCRGKLMSRSGNFENRVLSIYEGFFQKQLYGMLGAIVRQPFADPEVQNCL